MLSRCFLDFSVCVGAFVIGPSKISSFSLNRAHFLRYNNRSFFGRSKFEQFDKEKNRSPFEILSSA